jgi:predicted metal-dependent hydrolase
MANQIQTILLCGREVKYEFRRHHRARSVKISVYPGGRCAVTVPHWYGIPSAERFLREREVWVVRTLDTMYAHKDERLLSYRDAREYRRLRKQARMFIEEKLTALNEMYGFSYTDVSVRDQKTRWGSCSSKGRLSFSYKLLLLPEHLAEYVVVHELCHLQEMNHSPKFWKLVSRAFPQHKKARKELKRF